MNRSLTYESLGALLRARAAADSEKLAFTFLPGGSGAVSRITYGELDCRARSIARQLRSISRTAETPATVLAVFPPGIDFLIGFLGCLYAGAIAIPTRFPNVRRTVSPLEGIAADSGAAIGLTTTELQPALAKALPAVTWLEPCCDRADEFPAPVKVWADDIAYLQYTSGSTADPKGVIITHRNVMTNCSEVCHRWEILPESRIFSWLPHFHDLGLVFGLLASIHAGCECVFMPPMAFVQRPLRWLEALSDYRITHSAAPNFAYSTCAYVPHHQLPANLDLRTWRVAVIGAEPVRVDTLHRFTQRFQPFGFAPETFCPAFGLAENTLLTTSSRPGVAPVVRRVQSEALLQGSFLPALNGAQGTLLAASGGTDAETRIRIVDPESGTACAPGKIGEIWLAGPSVAQGYWRRPERSAEKFGARMADTGEGPFLRTGDYGVVDGGELFVLGRIDDMLIIRGANYVPDDIEQTIERCDPALEADGGVVFAVESEQESVLVAVQEVSRHALRGLDADQVVRAIQSAVSTAHDLQVAAVVLLSPRTLLRTHSGKKRRKECRRRFLEGTLENLFLWKSPKLADAPRIAPQAAARENGAAERAEKTVAWLREWAATRLNSQLMDERRSMPPYVVLDLGNHGVLGLQAQQRYGGLELDHRGCVRVLQQLAAIDTTLAIFVLGNNALGIRPILKYASEEKQNELLPLLAAGRELASFAVTEPGAGSNVRALAAHGQADGSGGWTLHGTKVWIGSAAWAGVINTFVRLDGPDGASGVTGFVLRQGNPGLRVGPEAPTMGLRAMVQSQVHLEGVRASHADLLGEPGNGLAVAMDCMEFCRFGLSAVSAGVMKRCLQLMVRHAHRRVVSTGRLIENPVTLSRISELTAAVTGVEALTDLVADRLDRGEAVPPEIYCACKTLGPEFAWRAADQLMQQFGGRGYIETNLAPQILRDTRILRIFEGPTETMNMHLGSRLIHSPAELKRFIADDLAQPALAAELEKSAAGILDHCVKSWKGFDPAGSRVWASVLAGEVGSLGLLLAVVEYQASRTPTRRLRRAVDWARQQFEARLVRALGEAAAEPAWLSAAEVEDWVAEYEQSIGNVEQTLAGEQTGIDPLLTIVEQPLERAAVSEIRNENSPHASAEAGSITTWLNEWISREFGVQPGAIRAAQRFSEYGMDSVTAMRLTNALSEWLRMDLPATLVWDHPTIPELAGHLAGVAARCSSSNGHGTAVLDAISDELKLLGHLEQFSDEEVERLLERLQNDGGRS